METSLNIISWIIAAVVLITLISIFLVCVFFIEYSVEKNIYCPNFGRSSELEVKYNFWAGGCFVNYQGQWIRSNNLRAGKLD